MWNQINLWIRIAAGVADLALLLRVLGLRLHRMYLFITMTCVLGVVFDAANLVFPTDRVAIYTGIFSVCLYPIVVWDIFEEISGAAAGLRRLAMMRMLGGLFLMSLIGMIWLSSLWDTPDNTGLQFSFTLEVFAAMILSSSCLSYLWIMRKGMATFKILPARNTQTWMLFYALTLGAEFALCVLLMIRDLIDPHLRETFSNGSDLGLNLFGIAVTLWCILKLRGLSTDMPAPVSESEPPA